MTEIPDRLLKKAREARKLFAPPQTVPVSADAIVKDADTTVEDTLENDPLFVPENGWLLLKRDTLEQYGPLQDESSAIVKRGWGGGVNSRVYFYTRCLVKFMISNTEYVYLVRMQDVMMRYNYRDTIS